MTQYKMNLKERIKKKNIQEWAKEKGYEILDPDGFDRKDPKVMTRPITEEDFEKGFLLCTIRKL